LISCQNPFDRSSSKQEQQFPQNMGRFSLNIAGANSDKTPRTVLPTTPVLNDFAVYELAFTATSLGNSQIFDRTNTTLASTPIVLVAGTYNLTVSAYKTSKTAANLMAIGTVNGIVISAGANTASTVTLEPIFTAIDPSQTGSFRWNITLPANVDNSDNPTLILYQGDQHATSYRVKYLKTDPTGTETGLPPGVYTIGIEIEHENDAIVWYELMHVYANLEGNFTKIFTDEDYHRVKYDVNFRYDNGAPFEYGSHPDLNLGSGVSLGVGRQSVLHGDILSAPAPVRPGYKLEGWYTDNACALVNKWNFTTKVHKDMTLYSKWIPNTASITFNIEAIEDGTITRTPSGSINLSRGAVLASKTVIITISGTHTSAKWKIDQVGTYTGTESGNNISSFTLDGTDTGYNTLGRHVLELTLTLANSKEYQVNIPFTVVP
jgi:uncharacterized repeat protein (TIGR02543 family)